MKAFHKAIRKLKPFEISIYFRSKPWENPMARRSANRVREITQGARRAPARAASHEGDQLRIFGKASAAGRGQSGESFENPDLGKRR